MTAFGHILLYITGGVVFTIIGFMLSRMLRPNRPNADKLSAYECGEEAIGTASAVQFNSKFYVVALLFIVFDVELVFLFPWATIYADKEIIEATAGSWGMYVMAEIIIFIAILIIGLVYAWKKGYLEWIKPTPQVPTFKSKVPKEMYEQLNSKEWKI